MNTAPVLVHSDPTDLLLNTARMRDAIHMEKLRFPIDPDLIQLDNAIHEGAAIEIDVRKAVATKAKDDEEKEQAKVAKAQELAAKAKEKKERKSKLQKIADEKAEATAAKKKEREEQAAETRAGIELRKKLREEKAAASASAKILKASQVIPSGGMQSQAGPSKLGSRVASLRSTAKVNYAE